MSNSDSAPAAADERIVALDVLRAIALLGMVVTHFDVEFLAGPAPSEEFGRVHAIDRYASALVGLFASGKFFSIFAFLFGASFVLQLDNAARRGADFGGRFTWRLVVLLAIGCVHQVFFTGDVLMTYAILGLLLIPLHRVPNGLLMWMALILVFNLPGILYHLRDLPDAPTPEQQRAALASSAQFHEMAQRGFEIKSQGSLAELARLNYGEALAFKWQFLVHTGRLWITFGCFLLGMYAARIRLFVDTEQNRRRMQFLLVAGLVVAAVSTALLMLFPPWQPPRHPIRAEIEIDVQQAAISAAYIAAATLLLWHKAPFGILSALGPVGRMALTTYLLHTAFGVFLFYGIGLGLMGQLGSGLAVLSAIAFFVAQVFLAHAWLARFTMGPVEWLWRSLTYLRWQPFLRRAASTPSR